MRCAGGDGLDKAAGWFLLLAWMWLLLTWAKHRRSGSFLVLVCLVVTLFECGEASHRLEVKGHEAKTSCLNSASCAARRSKVQSLRWRLWITQSASWCRSPSICWPNASSLRSAASSDLARLLTFLAARIGL